MTMYAIKDNKAGNYLEWCNNRWYCSSTFPQYKFSKEECKVIAEQMKRHYKHNLSMLDKDGNETYLSGRYIINRPQQTKTLFKFSLSK